MNEDLKEIQKMVNIVKRDGEVSLRYMKWFEHDQMMINQGRQEERENTEKERKRAEEEKNRADRVEQDVKKAKKLEALTRCLIKEGRYTDMERVLDDLEFRNQLFEEYKIE